MVQERRKRPISERFWAKVDRDGPTAFDMGPCWLWTASIVSTTGYGQFGVAKGSTATAHRWAWESVNGPVPQGLQLDHLCRVRACVRPDHLEPVTQRENLLRGETVVARAAAATHCPAGHAYAGDNLRIRASGHRACVECDRRRSRESYAATHASRAEAENARARARYAARKAF
jgi:hypothetical protein